MLVSCDWPSYRGTTRRHFRLACNGMGAFELASCWDPRRINTRRRSRGRNCPSNIKSPASLRSGTITASALTQSMCTRSRNSTRLGKLLAVHSRGHMYRPVLVGPCEMYRREIYSYDLRILRLATDSRGCPSLPLTFPRVVTDQRKCFDCA